MLSYDRAERPTVTKESKRFFRLHSSRYRHDFTRSLPSSFLRVTAMGVNIFSNTCLRIRSCSQLVNSTPLRLSIRSL
ncbi:uncharacterized protein EI97DRAFT_226489 [Westerdykella ornata]|uniref:Uncharacterized protein n=1 Tax=Westerdykella ornata TaxID=318751 RepID=A0A6A6JS09_WESOR|nr:uncharacterized protein EI97DRAFT_226489 [Westerdykella ornata]KAF2279054.1 hypothetical protein EI97DRAFT_226489 [Westerdykella ornata]